MTSLYTCFLALEHLFKNLEGFLTLMSPLVRHASLLSCQAVKRCRLHRAFRRLLYFVDILVVSEKDTEYKIERARDWFQAFLILGNCLGRALQKGGIRSG